MSAGLAGLLSILHHLGAVSAPTLIGSAGNGPNYSEKVLPSFIWGCVLLVTEVFHFEACDIFLLKNVHTDFFLLGFLAAKCGLFTCHCGYWVEQLKQKALSAVARCADALVCCCVTAKISVGRNVCCRLRSGR